jgi:hypothetical protein
MSAYHGGDMEGPSAWRLIGDGEKILLTIADYIKNHIREQEDSSVLDLAPLHVTLAMKKLTQSAKTMKCFLFY